MQDTDSPKTGPVRLTLDEAVNRAFAAYSAGQHAVADELLTGVLRQSPDRVDALHLHGLAKFALGDAEAAAGLVKAAVEAEPDNAEFVSNLTEILRNAGRLEEAVEYGKRAVELAPKSSNALSNLGIVYYDMKDYEAAEDCQRRALEIRPSHLQALNNMGSIKRMQDDREAAIGFYQRVLEFDPDYAESANNLASLYLETDRPDDALQLLLPLVRRAPTAAEVHRNIARAFMLKSEWDKAEMGFRNALKHKPDMVEAQVGLSRVFKERGNLEQALREAEKALQMAPDSAAAHQNLAGAVADLGDSRRAMELYNAALELDPEHGPSLLGRGHLAMEEGDLDAARADFAKAIELAPDELSARFAMVRLDKVTEDDPNFAFLQETESRYDELPSTRKIAQSFALAKCHEDLKHWDEAFPLYLRGCTEKRATIEYDPEVTSRKVEGIRAFFTPERIEQLRKAAINAEMPIFVVGMPRSGTTLTESIIASHPQVFGAGELHEMHRIFGADAGADAETYPFHLEKWSLSRFADGAEKYVADVHAKSEGHPFVTDKMPANFQFAGLIHALLPKAPIVHIRRHPLDTCLSCFTRLFERSQYQSYDLRELGRYYADYVRIMEHWEAVLPPGAILHVQYEDLVENFEERAREIIAHCGLPWDDACLRFNEQKRRVRTASVTQVRQPIYTTSRQKWKVYESHLAPLIETLKEHGVEMEGVD